jgi:hypothetical protein
MKLLGFNFIKISATKNQEPTKDLKINTKIDILDINEGKAEFFKVKEDLLGVHFIYSISYEPGYANIELEGNILLAVESKMVKDVLSQWKEKQIPEDFRFLIFNIVLKKSSIKAMQLEEELNLPLHLPIPSLRREEKKED